MNCWTPLISFWFVLTAGFAVAQQDVTITRITGEQEQIRLDSIADGVVLGGDTKIDLNDLMMIQTGQAIVSERSSFSVFIFGGGRLGVTGIDFDGEQFVLFGEWGKWTVSPDAIKGILLDQDADRSRFDRALANRSVEQDVVIARSANGQGVVRGLIESIDVSKVVLNHNGKSRSVSLTKVIGIVTADLKPGSSPGQPGTVHLINGSSVTGTIQRLNAGVLTVGLPGDATIEISMSIIAALSLQSPHVRYLSDLEPVVDSSNPLATQDFSWQRDLSVQSNPLRLYSPKTGKTIEYSKGIGTHSASRLEFDVPGEFNRFSALVGIDAETQGKGDCLVSVWADGIKLWEDEIAGSLEPVQVDVDISGMNRVALVVRHGRHLDLGDHVDWADARFLVIQD